MIRTTGDLTECNASRGCLPGRDDRGAQGVHRPPPGHPAQRARLEEIHDNLNARIAEAEHEGRLGEIEGVRTSPAGAEDKLARIDQRSSRAIDLGMPGRAAGPVRSATPAERRT
ncbi:hypothetical protein [Streptomyces brevispora]|uniref:hypothetical protein n=1 Tax=Streptomyces brevispora TaxID=887462 RepID=UPI00142F2656|nr:hypothetical protein [Streptomyces brevispora]